MDTNHRTDIHRPSAIVPSAYQYVGIWTMNIVGFSEAEFMLRERDVCKTHMERTGGHVVHKANGSCGICGNQLAIFLTLFHHAESNEYIVVGVNCAQKLEMGADFDAIERFKRRYADAREQQAGKRKAIALLGDWGLIDAWEVFEAAYPVHSTDCAASGKDAHGDDNGAFHACTCDVELRMKAYASFPESTIRDIVNKLIRWGSISEKQQAFVKSLLKQIADRPIVEAQRQAEKDAAGPVPTGRVLVSGVVVGTKEVEAPVFGYSRFSGRDEHTVTKLIIKLENGSKVYGSSFASAKKGDAVKFTATFEASKDDPKFGFYKRAKEYVEAPVLSDEAKKQVKRLKGVIRGINRWEKDERATLSYGTVAGYMQAYNEVYQVLESAKKG